MGIWGNKQGGRAQNEGNRYSIVYGVEWTDEAPETMKTKRARRGDSHIFLTATRDLSTYFTYIFSDSDPRQLDACQTGRAQTEPQYSV